ncbi:MAG: 1-(5-phosphoribosyl)-5-[(5-phosphoribosylamino)methylideneamino]imidazole-4-carboxamide isomerase, partial [Balneolaceae bacterium]
PAIDLLDGQVVRLTKGDYQQKKIYHNNPLEQARIFKDEGFHYIHIVDLNGAKSGKFENLPHIRKIIETLGLSVQTGGGIRSQADIDTLLEAGISKVICSSMAVKKPEEWLAALKQYPEQCILGMDLKNGKMAYGGWLKTSDQSLEGFLTPMLKAGLNEVLSTDISKDGTLEGPNVGMYVDLKYRFPDLKWIASGGVSSEEDLERLIETGVSGVVVGKAYYEGRIGLKTLANFNRNPA